MIAGNIQIDFLPGGPTVGTDPLAIEILGCIAAGASEHMQNIDRRLADAVIFNLVIHPDDLQPGHLIQLLQIVPQRILRAFACNVLL